MAATAPETGGLRVAFAGTPEFAACALEAILAAGYEVPLVLTQPDRPAGRGMKLTPSAVKKLALDRGIEVDQPEKLRTEEQRARLAACAPDLLVVAAYGLILPTAVLELPRLGCLNIHASLLPRWRGAAPIHRAIEAGDARTGITIMQMDEGLDTGDMIRLAEEPIHPGDTTATLHDRLAALGGRLIVEVLGGMSAGRPAAAPQPLEGVTYAHKIDKKEAAIDWTRPADALARRVRAFDPFPGAHFVCEGEAVKLWEAEPVAGRGAPGEVLAAGPEALVVACGEGALALRRVQRPGGRRQTVREWLAARPLAAGTRLG